MVNIEDSVARQGVEGLVPSTVFELVAEVRQLQEAYTLLRKQFDERGEALVIANEQVKQAKSERLEAELATRLVDDAYWRRVEYAAAHVVGGLWAKGEVVGLSVVVKEARALIDEIDLQRHAAD